MAAKKRRVVIPDRGDVVKLSFDPTVGHEQRGFRPAVVVSTKEFNKKTGMAWLIPVTNTARGSSFEVAISGEKEVLTGVVITHQIRAVDYRARQVQLQDKLTAEELAQVMLRVQVVVA